MDSDGRSLAQARLQHRISIAVAIIAFAVLVYGFGMLWMPWYQVPAGLAAWLAIEWQRRCGRKVKALQGQAQAGGSATAA